MIRIQILLSIKVLVNNVYEKDEYTTTSNTYFRIQIKRANEINNYIYIRLNIKSYD